MNYFWGNVFDYFKDRKVAGVFFGSLLISIGLLLIGAFVWQTVGPERLQENAPYILSAMALIFIVWVAKCIRDARARLRNRYKSSPLSRDELGKARSKLRRARN